ncbi:putative V-type ATP synthase [Ordospora colligata]|uniref:Putative V-type ATP synthase n=1 Tax=Ordospora colligata OC4 TaxID=1354746 RepID=A0A0B2UE88_9MICR|nr:putative V-type ATP synthase [Ordospora colligata OC4]KHN69396.1 putative V-type ATP synthase [Ordospora colligata OC4]TBU14910.1 putative V-type ATP synthase [Ordospora colligata]TBU15041.1 putative V-type ATP synthase [Ordospora colligata]TBU18295.1 putative V-type ATP synthase [Ordospora colligata]
MELDEKTLSLIISKIGPGLMVSISAIGSGLGFISGTEGICKAAEHSVNTTYSLIPIIFITAPTMYSVILYFMVYDKHVETLSDGLLVLSACIINGVSSGAAAYSIGHSAKYACVVRALQPKFLTTFFLVFIFGELTGLLGLVCAMAMSSNIGKA